MLNTDLFQYVSHIAIVRPEGDEVTRGRKKLYSDKLHNLSSLATTRAIESRRACSMDGRDKKYKKKILVRKPEKTTWETNV